MVLLRVSIPLEHVQDAALVCGFWLMVRWVGLAIAGATSGHFVCETGCRFFRRVKLLSSLKIGCATDRAAEMVDVGVVSVLHRFFIRPSNEYGIEFVCSL